MKQINGLTDQPKQQTTLVLADGSRATLLLEYCPNQFCWFYGIVWGTFEADGMTLVPSPNALRQLRTRIPFGLALITAGNVELADQQAFINGVATLYLLDSTEVDAIEAAIYPGT